MISVSELRQLHTTVCANAYNGASTPAVTEQLLSMLRSDYKMYGNDERLLITELFCAWAYGKQEAMGVIRALRKLSKMRSTVNSHAERALLYLNSGIAYLRLGQPDRALENCNKAYYTFASTGEHNSDAMLTLLYIAQAQLVMSRQKVKHPKRDLKRLIDFCRAANTVVSAEHWVLALAWLSFVESVRKRRRQSSRYIDRALRILEENKQLVHSPVLHDKLLDFQAAGFDQRRRHVQLIMFQPPQFQLLKL